MSSLSEFSLIETYFKELTFQRPDVLLGIGDDCALLSCPNDKVLAVSIDTLVESIHFFSDVDPENLGYKSLAVGLSDLAAMGATPAWFTLALTLPDVSEDWLKNFSLGLASLANQHNIQLVGGDTTKGPLTISIQVHGFVEPKQAFRRSGAQVGDDIYVTGCLGDAGAGLQLKLQQWKNSKLTLQDKKYLFQRLERPTPRLDFGQVISKFATSAIDISDGLSSDLNHILNKSHVGATLDLTRLPLSSTLQKIDPIDAYNFAMNSGDDYELCFTIPAAKQIEFESMVPEGCTRIGVIDAKLGLRMTDVEGQEVSIKRAGYDHFTKG